MNDLCNISGRFIPSSRLCMLLLLFYGAICFYLVRVNFGVSIVCMTVDPVTNDTLGAISSTNDTRSNLTQHDQCTIVQQDGRQVHVQARVVALCGNQNGIYSVIFRLNMYKT